MAVSAPYCYSFAFVKHRIAAHRRAAEEPERGHMAAVHAQWADLWETQLRAFYERRPFGNLRILDWYRPAPF